jgi:hypothetical protein
MPVYNIPIYDIGLYSTPIYMRRAAPAGPFNTVIMKRDDCNRRAQGRQGPSIGGIFIEIINEIPLGSSE